MCAECHSTDLRKNFDPDSGTHATTWSEISVGCKACHGPGGAHVDWARMPDMARPEVENSGLAVKTAGMNTRQQIELCAPCHSRRMSLYALAVFYLQRGRLADAAVAVEEMLRHPAARDMGEELARRLPAGD